MTVTAADGTTTSAACPAALPHRLRRHHADLLPEYWHDAASVAAGTDVVVREKPGTAIGDARLARAGPSPATVTGSGIVLADARVTATPMTRGRVVGAGLQHLDRRVRRLPPRRTRRDTPGGLPQSQYGHLEEFWDEAATVEDATSIPVAAGADVPTPTQTRAGRADHRAGHRSRWCADRGAWVAVFQDRGDWGLGVGVRGPTPTRRRLRASGLPTGRYVVRFESWTGDYLDEFWDDARILRDRDPVSVTAGATVAATDAELRAQRLDQRTLTRRCRCGRSRSAAFEKVGDQWQACQSTGSRRTVATTCAGIDGGTYRLRFEDWSDSSGRSSGRQALHRPGAGRDRRCRGHRQGRDAVLAPVRTDPDSHAAPDGDATPTPTPAPSVAAQLSSIARTSRSRASRSSDGRCG